ncbi:MAG TPA: hypothetical protein VFO05_10250 [Candidatus Limnocylindrales bacterium]|nr:hypothetical protein [Candidatus Limnocylindrales bacterium]
MRRTLLSATGVILLLTLGPRVVLAGEITGTGESLKPLHANSECAFSGLDDADDDGFVRTQNWGQLPKAQREFFETIGVAPSSLCNGHLSPLRD